ncbi:concanavalin A-like lectin/glucanase domain-containing protein [Gongronella butleri]|nr:concanavalin A-like lectin/glucanase domain-containing protein [Gongronella butleri]
MDYSNNDAPPPSYQLEQQRHEQQRPEGVVHDASVDAFERGEAYVANCLGVVDHLAPSERLRVLQQGPKVNVMVVQRDLPRTDAYEVAHDQLTVAFWPKKARKGGFSRFLGRHSSKDDDNDDGDLDVMVQARDAWIAMDEESGGTVHYFEMEILALDADVVVAIGLATRPYPWFRLPGWNKHSLGYHSDDGNKFLNDPTVGYVFGPSFGQGDTVGCLYHVEQGNVYFTLNGAMIQEPAFVGLDTHIFYPTIGADGAATVRLNFGTRAFKYACPSWVGHVF